MLKVTLQKTNKDYAKATTINDQSNQLVKVNLNEFLMPAKSSNNTKKIDMDTKGNTLKMVLQNNPHLEYKGIEKQIIGGSKNSVEVNCYKIYDSKNKITIYIQRTHGAIEKADDLMVAINKLDNRKNLINKVDVIRVISERNPDDVYWADQMNTDNFYSAANGGNGEINFFGCCDGAYMQEIIFHESGHCLDKNFKYSNSQEYYNAICKDYNWVSQYASDSFYNRDYYKCAEDFADSVKSLELLGAKKFTELYPNRAAYFKKILPEYFN